MTHIPVFILRVGETTIPGILVKEYSRGSYGVPFWYLVHNADDQKIHGVHPDRMPDGYLYSWFLGARSGEVSLSDPSLGLPVGYVLAKRIILCPREAL